MKVLRAIGQFFVRIWRWLVWVTRRPSKREFRVVRCPDMGSMVGMKCWGTPKVGVSMIFTKNTTEGHRFITPVTVKKIKGGNREIYTKHIYIFVKRIK